MEEEIEELTIDPFRCEEDIDLDYEFDAPRFCDFTQPETDLEATEAEQWFEFAESYPPAPFVLKLRWGNAISMESGNSLPDDGDGANDSCHCTDIEEVSETEDTGKDLLSELEYWDQTIEDTLNGKTESLIKSTQSKSKVFSFMKPTASHLAKQKNPTEVPTPRSFRRIQNQSSSSIDIQLTKRQKLEAGYLRKAARLKHQTSFSHKKTNEATVPREPNLVTALRAQRHKSRPNAESGGCTKSSSHMFKARPLNKKIFEPPSPFHKKKAPQLTEFREFHFKTSERAMQHTSSSNAGDIFNNSMSNSETRNPERISSPDGSRQEKCRMVNKLGGSHVDKQLSSKGERGVFRKIFPLEPNKKFQNEPPSELFSKLSLASEVKKTTKSHSKEQPISKGLKENRPGSFYQEHQKLNLVKEEIQRLWGKQYQCVNEMGSLISNHACMLEPGH